jgi:hypothetical protein
MTYNASSNTQGYDKSKYWPKPEIVGGGLRLIGELPRGTNGSRRFLMRTSAYLTKKQPITNFSTSFTVSWDPDLTRYYGNAKPGNTIDYLTFSIQNLSPESIGTARPGGAIFLKWGEGGFSAGFVTSPKGVDFISTTIKDHTGTGYRVADANYYAKGLDTGLIQASLGLKFDGKKSLLNVEIKYSNNTLVLILTNAENTYLAYTHRFNNVDLPTLLGSTKAWMGFTVGGGEMIYSRNGGYSRWPYPPKMTISNWKIQNI